ncbi:unnamed protein product [Ectocarpus fasciculatus]
MKALNKKWNSIDWKEARTFVSDLQQKMVVAYKNNNWSEVFRLQQQLMHSFEGRATAVRKVVSNEGSKTKGPDGKTWEKSQDKYRAIADIRDHLLTKSGSYKAGAVRRVWIPKSSPGELRPLGIPNMIDRALQALVLSCLDPIVEENSDSCSYGFRKYRSSNDAIQRIRFILDKAGAPRYIWDADISKCFDNISHTFLNRMVGENLCRKGCELVGAWLKAPIIEKGSKSYPRRGTPQGGVLSPLLCNMTLNGLENVIRDGLPSSSSTAGRKLKGRWVVRYADDFIITNPIGKSQFIDNDIPLINKFMADRGLEISEKKSRIIDLEKESFNFLGWKISQRKRNVFVNKASDSKFVLVVEPTKESIKRLKSRIKLEFRSNKPIGALIKDLNPVLRGWANYYRGSYHSQQSFQSIGHYVYQLFWKWAQKKHPSRNKQWIYDRYIVRTEKRSWRIGVDKNLLLYDITQAKQIRVSNLKNDINPYTDDDYFVNRVILRDADKFRKAIYKLNKFRCFVCRGSLYGDEPIHLHHLIARKDGGEYTLKNIVPVHAICHDSITYAVK